MCAFPLRRDGRSEPLNLRTAYRGGGDGQHILFCKDQFAGPLPMATQLSLLADAGHVIARLTNRVQRATILGRQRTV
jgi:hypothetical protein